MKNSDNKYLYLIKNIGLFSISSFGSRILTFLLVPLYTSVLSTEEYGIYDFIHTTANLLIPIVTLNITEAILVFTLDNDYDNKSVLSIGIKHSIVGTLIVLVFCILNNYFKIFEIKYWQYLPVMILVSTITNCAVYFSKGLDFVKDVAISGFLSTFTMILLNVLFLLKWKFGLNGYFIAYILGIAVQFLYLFIKCKLWQYIDIRSNIIVKKQMQSFSIPLIFNSISWWLNNYLDRYVIIYYIGLSASGIYAVGYKIPTILNIFQGVFSSAWSISSIKDFDPIDKNSFFLNVYEFYNFALCILCSLIIILSRILSKILYAKDFYNAWVYVPFLTIAFLFGAMSGYLGSIFVAVKDSKLFAISTIIGAVINTILNIILVRKIGVLGAAIATTISYFIIWAIRFSQIKLFIQLNVPLYRDLMVYILLLIQTIVLIILQDYSFSYFIQIIIILLMLLLFRNEIVLVYNRFVRLRNN